jgi:hypothetical protein
MLLRFVFIFSSGFAFRSRRTACRQSIPIFGIIDSRVSSQVSSYVFAVGIGAALAAATAKEWLFFIVEDSS